MPGSLDLNLLRVFDAVMTEKNVTRAALVLHMTQPAVSNAINRLRLTLGDPLFIKVHGGVAATSRAQSLWPPIHEALQRIAEVLDDRGFDPARSHALFRFAMSDYVTDQIIRPLFAALRVSAPGIRIHLRPHAIRNATSLLEKGEIDIAAGVFSNFSPGIRALAVDTLTYVCAMRADHPMARRARLSIDDFMRARHLVVSLAGGTSLVDQELAEQGVKREAVLTVNQFALVPRLLAETDLVCIVPANTIKGGPYAGQLCAVELPIPIQPRTVSLIWHERSDGLPEHRWLREQIQLTCEAAGARVSASGSLQSHAY